MLVLILKVFNMNSKIFNFGGKFNSLFDLKLDAQGRNPRVYSIPIMSFLKNKIPYSLLKTLKPLAT